MSATRMTVAVVGTGRMGAAMAAALAQAGHDLVLHNRTRRRAEETAAETGGRVVATAAEAAESAQVVITMLPDGDAVSAAFAGPDGLIAGAHPGAVLVDMSTVLPDTIRSVARAVRARGAGLLDSPVSGSVELARKGQLTLMVGGEVEDLERARPALEAVSKAIFHLGPLGSGAAMKLAVNTVIFGLNGALAEALVLADAAGVSRSQAYDVLAASAVGAPYVQYKRSAFLEPDATPVQFPLELAEKDLGLITAFAESLRVSVPQAAANLDLVRRASTDGRRGLDFSTVTNELRARSDGYAQAVPDGGGTREVRPA